MYSSIYRVQSSTRRLPIQALFGFTLKLVELYLSPSSQSLCVVVCPWYLPWVTSVVQIYASVVPIPLFWVDIPTASEGIRLCSEASRAEADGKVELGEVL